MFMAITKSSQIVSGGSGVHAAVRAEQPADPRLGALEPALHAPVLVVDVAGLLARGHQHQLAARGAGPVAHRSDELANGVRLEHRVGVGEDDELRIRQGHEVVQHARLAAVDLEGFHAHARVHDAPGQHDGAVAAAVGAHQDAQPVGRVVLGEQVLDARGDVHLFVEGGDDDGHARQFLAGRGRRRPGIVAAAREEREDGGIDQVGVGEQRHGAPEDGQRRGGDHATLAAAAGSACWR
jgi:hypothetical protein